MPLPPETCFIPLKSPLDQIQGAGGKDGKLQACCNPSSDGVEQCVEEQASVSRVLRTTRGEQVFLDGVVMSEAPPPELWIVYGEKMSQEDAYPECTVPCDQLYPSFLFGSVLEARVV